MLKELYYGPCYLHYLELLRLDERLKDNPAYKAVVRPKIHNLLKSKDFHAEVREVSIEIPVRYSLVNMIIGDCEVLLISGQFNTYRGVLSQMGEELLRLYRKLHEIRKEQQFWNNEDMQDESTIEEEMSWIRGQIKQVG